MLSFFLSFLFSFFLSNGRITDKWGTDFPKRSGNCAMILILFRKSELRPVLSFWIFEASYLYLAY